MIATRYTPTSPWKPQVRQICGPDLVLMAYQLAA